MNIWLEKFYEWANGRGLVGSEEDIACDAWEAAWRAALAAAPTPPEQSIKPCVEPYKSHQCLDCGQVIETPPAQEDEPFMYAIMGPDGKPHFDEICVSGVKGDLSDAVYYLNEERGAGQYKEIPLYTRPDNSELRKAAERAATRLESYLDYETAANLRAALNKGKS